MAGRNFRTSSPHAIPTLGPDARAYDDRRLTLDLNGEVQIRKTIFFYVNAQNVFNVPSVNLRYGSTTPAYAKQFLVGQKTFDLLRVIDWLKDNGHTEVHVIAKGWGAIPATFAALLSDTVVQVTLKQALKSYSDVAESEDYTWPLSTFLPGVLKKFDLPDCYRELAAKNLRQIAPAGARDGGLSATVESSDSP